ncbi:hypothetical protein [Streptococcus orisratti]|uniref:hypothetical protein n=1 Tax=Streptococcus orisratti TaxID=114652 RepID=UPI0012E9C9B4|nr:hypothetical protein [Streptococcus orisratti]
MTQLAYSLLDIPQATLSNDTNISLTINVISLPLIILVLGVFGPFVEEIIYRYILYSVKIKNSGYPFSVYN